MIDFDRDGRLWLRGALSGDEIGRLLDACEAGAGPGARISLSDGLADALLATSAVRRIRSLWRGMEPVRAVLFDKSDAANWGLPWHQDRVIAVRERAEVPGFRNWTRKSGVWHCEPPLALLRQMLFVRFHLDACSEDTGAMEIAVGSHRVGLVAAEAADEAVRACATEVTEADAGDVLVLSMLTLHRSRAATRPDRRRVLRVDFCAVDPPPQLDWAT